jgi:hypothetical protein
MQAFWIAKFSARSKRVARPSSRAVLKTVAGWLAKLLHVPLS